MIITIDGPAASGKSTVAKALAQELGYYYLYTGLLYRAVAHILLTKCGKKTKDFGLLGLSDLEFISEITYQYKDGKPQILFKQEDITPSLGDHKLDLPASTVSANPYVRKGLLEIQHFIGSSYNIIADGRDCGTVVFPKADFKFYLTADLTKRAKRIQKKMGLPLEEVKRQLAKRDKQDMERAIAPLKIPKSAVVIDNTNLNKAETLKAFLNVIKKSE